MPAGLRTTTQRGTRRSPRLGTSWRQLRLASHRDAWLHHHQPHHIRRPATITARPPRHSRHPSAPNHQPATPPPSRTTAPGTAATPRRPATIRQRHRPAETPPGQSRHPSTPSHQPATSPPSHTTAPGTAATLRRLATNPQHHRSATPPQCHPGAAATLRRPGRHPAIPSPGHNAARLPGHSRRLMASAPATPVHRRVARWFAAQPRIARTQPRSRDLPRRAAGAAELVSSGRRVGPGPGSRGRRPPLCPVPASRP